MADPGSALCTYAQFTEGPFKDLATGIAQTTIQDMLLEGTRMCEDACDRRLVPFTKTETQRASGIDPDEYSDAANLPMDIRSVLGASYAASLGASALVRHCWIDEYAPRYTDMWAYSNVTVTIIRSYGGTQILAPTQILNGPEPDTGHLWFQLGQFIPVGSRIQVAYSGGYQSFPASLVRANKLMTAYLIITELNPAATAHDPAQLHTDAMMIMADWAR